VKRPKGKRAFVTGCSRGIGGAAARRFAAANADVAFGYERSADAENATPTEIEPAAGRAVAIQINAVDPASIERAVDRAAAELGGPDILVGMAGTIRYGAVEEITLGQIDAMLTANFCGVILPTQAAMAHISDGGRLFCWRPGDRRAGYWGARPHAHRLRTGRLSRRRSQSRRGGHLQFASGAALSRPE